MGKLTANDALTMSSCAVPRERFARSDPSPEGTETHTMATSDALARAVTWARSCAVLGVGIAERFTLAPSAVRSPEIEHEWVTQGNIAMACRIDSKYNGN